MKEPSKASSERLAKTSFLLLSTEDRRRKETGQMCVCESFHLQSTLTA